MKISYLINFITVKLLARVLISREKISWFFQYKALSRNQIKVDEFSFNKKDKILIIVPHADDELIGCYQLIKKHRDNVELFYCGYTGSKSSKENYDIRLSEFKHVCKNLNVKYTIASESVKESLYLKISEYSPNYIFVPSFIDWHDEHNKSSIMLLDLIDESCKIVLYQVSVPICTAMVNYYVPMNKKEHKEKWKTFYDMYHSQRHIPILRFRYNEMVNKIGNKIYGVESFSVLQFNLWKKLLHNFQEQRNLIKLQKLKSSVNNLKEVRNQTTQIYKLINRIEE